MEPLKVLPSKRCVRHQESDVGDDFGGADAELCCAAMPPIFWDDMPHPRNLILGHKLKRVKLEAMAIDGFHCQNLQAQALTTDHETRHCIHVFLNAYRKTAKARSLATSSLPREQYEWHDWTCNSPQFIMQQFKRFMHESLLCLRNVVASGVCCTKTPTNKRKLNIFLYQQTTRHGIAQMFFEAHVEKHHQRAMSRHLRSRAISMKGTTGHAANLNY